MIFALMIAHGRDPGAGAWFGRPWLAAMAVLSVVAVVPATAHAGGFTIPIIGGRMSGQAAFVAHPDDTSAVYHNPAGLVLIEGRLRVDVSGTHVFTNTAYTRVDYPASGADTGGPGDFDTSRKPTGPCPAEGAATGYDARGYVLAPCYRPRVEPKSHYGMLPYGGVAWNPHWKGLKNLAFGLGVYSPQNAQADFPADGAQRYEVTSGAITTLYITPAAAWRPHRAIAVGAGVSAIYASAKYKRVMWLPDDIKALNNGNDLLVSLDGGAWTVGYTFGAIFFPGELTPKLKGLEIGTSYVSRAALNFGGTISVDGASQALGGTLQDGYVEGQTIKRDATAQFTLPDMVRLGFGYDFGPRAWAGVDLYWSHYQLYESLAIRLKENLGSIQDFVMQKNSHDSWSLGLGGRYTPRDWLDLRAGLFFDQSPYPNAYYTTLSPDSNKYGFTTGLSLRPKFLYGGEVTLAYMVLFYSDRRVTDSQSRPNYSEVAFAPYSANGQVVGKIVHLLVTQLSWTLGAKR
jgi:long-subunit fatty acid transport protein